MLWPHPPGKAPAGTQSGRGISSDCSLLPPARRRMKPCDTQPRSTDQATDIHTYSHTAHCHTTLTTFHTHNIPHSQHPTLTTSHTHNTPHSQHPTLTTPHTHNTPHSQHPTLTTPHTHNTPHSQHPTLTTPHTHNTPHSQHPTGIQLTSAGFTTRGSSTHTVSSSSVAMR